MKNPDLILFSKQPVAGQVKSRLHGVYGPQRAAEIAAFCIHRTVELATASWPGDVYLYGWPDAGHELYAGLAAAFPIDLGRQSGGDLGEKMSRALEQGIARAGAAAVMGCDVPHCPGAALRQAYDALASGKNVIGPTQDGGYYFIGLQRVLVELFTDIPWGGPAVLARTLARAAEQAMEFVRLPELRDLDRPEDLRAVAAGYPPLEQFLQAESSE